MTVRAPAGCVPASSANSAVRTLADAPAGTPIAVEVLTELGLALAVGMGWLPLAALILERLATAGRRTGSIEFAD